MVLSMCTTENDSPLRLKADEEKGAKLLGSTIAFRHLSGKGRRLFVTLVDECALPWSNC